MQRCVRKGGVWRLGDCSENCLRILVMSCKINVIFTDKTPWVLQRMRRKEEVKGPYCNAQDTKVIDSRPADDNSSIRRRRQCEKCGKRFTTYEKLETMPLMVIKKDRSRETYDRSKIESGIIHSCHKRPVSTQQINAMIDEIENQIFNMEEKEVETTVIGELVMRKLKQLDEVAYVRFASVYREFKDVNTFMEELGKLLQNK